MPFCPLRPLRALRRRAPLIVVLWTMVALPGLGACRRAAKPTDYADAARAEYQKGHEQFEDDNFLEAIKTFNIVRTRHPYSRFATLAELRIADAQFKLGKHAEAAAAYRAFVRFHPHHPERPYAMYRVGVCFYEQIPGDWWFMPPAHERELGSTSDALRELGGFVRAYPTDERVPDAKEKMGRLRRRLADFELYVARFYHRQRKHRAVASRAAYLVRTYPDVGLTPTALLLQGRAELEIPERAAAVATLRRIVSQHGSTDEAQQARQELERLGAPLTEPSPPSAAPEAAAPPALPSAAPASAAPAAPAAAGEGSTPAAAAPATPAAPAVAPVTPTVPAVAPVTPATDPAAAPPEAPPAG